MKSAICIGEDGSNLGWNKVCNEKVLTKLYEDVGEDADMLCNLEGDGLIFILEENDGIVDDWAKLVEESKDMEYVTYEEVLAKVRECLIEEMNNSD